MRSWLPTRLTTMSWLKTFWPFAPRLMMSTPWLAASSTRSMSAMNSGFAGSVMSKMSTSWSSMLSTPTRKARGPSCQTNTEW